MEGKFANIYRGHVLRFTIGRKREEMVPRVLFPVSINGQDAEYLSHAWLSQMLVMMDE